ncbi:sortase family protein [Parvimonas sp. oral taxon 110 str. F0139]|nr:sortase family protein [Parvimonas sp. oral taxon 110 str. F0139]
MSDIDIKISKKKSKKKSNWPFILVFLLGFGILMYPIITRLYYRVESKNVISTFDSEKEKLSKEEVKRRMELAKAYNSTLHNEVTKDPYSDEKKKEGKAEYARMIEIHEYIGHVQIPTIDVDVPIYAGTDEEVLQKGAGHLEGTSLPIGGINTHTVITAHSGLPTATLFTNLSKLQIGDKFYIHNFAETLAYQIDQIKVVEPSTFDDLLISEGKDYATLLTCTPYMINTHRLLVRGHRVEYDKDIVDKELLEGKKNIWYMYLFYFILFLLVILIISTLYYVRKRKKFSKKLEKIDVDNIK